MSLFSTIEAAPKDPILGLTDAFRADPNPAKINLSVGIYQDDQGLTPILPSVVEAGRRVLAGQTSGKTTMSYLPIPGAPAYAAAVQELLFGAGHEVLTSGRATTAHSPGGTGALRVVADFLHNIYPGAAVYMTDPTWPNHPSIFQAAGVATHTVPYFDAATNSLAFDKLVAALEQIPAGSAVLLHGCCHNPTGIDPTQGQWQTLAQVIRKQGLLPILDFAYQGFADGIEADTAGLKAFAEPGAELIICSSFSKNFGLYCERVGAVTFVAGDAATAARVQSQVNKCIRANYSNPPANGAALVTTVLLDPALRKQWEQEVADMRTRINGMRHLFVKKLAEHGAKGDFEFITRQRGMFSFSGLTPTQVGRLRDEYAIYAVGSGRINVAGITTANIDRLALAIATVTA